MTDEDKGVKITDSRKTDKSDKSAAGAAPIGQQEERSGKKVRVKPIAAFNSPHGFKNHDSEPFDASQDWAVQARAQGIIEYVDEADEKSATEEAAKAASEKAREMAARRRAGLPDEHKSTPLKQAPLVMEHAPPNSSKK